MSRVAAILGFCLLGFVGAVFAQDHVKWERRPARASMIDSFGQVGHCDAGARLDNFAIVLQSQPSARGAVISYGPEGDGPGTGKRYLEMIKDYFVNTRGITDDRIETIYGGRNSDKYQTETQLWIVPTGTSLPKPEKRETNIETFQGLYLDSGGYDDFDLEFVDEMGPGIGNSTYASFADMLHVQKNVVPYIVVYSAEDQAPGAWRRVGEKNIGYFKDLDVEPSRFKLIFAGQQKESRVQYWILPNNAPPPVADAGSEKALAKTVKAGDFSFYVLDDEDNQKKISSRLSQILTVDKSVRAFLVVYLPQPEPGEPTEEVAQPVAIQLPEPTAVEEKPPLDLTKLVEKWRVEVSTTHKIEPDRLIIVFASEPPPGSIRLWIVPKGAPLPNIKEEEESPDDGKDDPPVKP